LPFVSAALHVTVLLPRWKVEPEAGEQLELATASSGSLALNEYVTGAPLDPVASAVMLAGTVITGGVIRTVTLKEAFELLVWASVAEQCTVVVPTMKLDPEAGEQLELETVSSGSVKLTEYVTAALVALLCASTVMSAGTPIDGAVVSKGAMVTLNCNVEVFPRPSSAVHVTCVVPTGNVDPEGGAQLTDAAAPRSVAEGVGKGTALPLGEVASSEMGSWLLVKVGAVVSCTLTLNDAVESLPFPSLLVHCTEVVPIGKGAPDAGEQLTGRVPVTASLALGLV
jgi:hypothetical protein